MKKIFYLIFGGLLLLSCQQEKKADLVLQGKTQKDEIAVVSKIPGRLLEIRVHTGDLVKKGDTLAVLDIPEVEAKKEQAGGALTSATAQYEMTRKGATDNQLRQLNEKKRALQEQYNFAKKSLDRLQVMVKDSLIPQQQYDEVFAKYQGALAQLNAVQAEIADVQHGVRTEQQVMALGQQERAQGAMAEVKVAEKERYILAPQDMTISTITLSLGELALPGYTLFKGTLEDSTRFRFTIPESELSQYQVGKELTITVPYKDNLNLKGRVESLKSIGSYANIATAYPDFNMQDPLYEIVVTPVDKGAAASILDKTTVLLNR